MLPRVGTPPAPGAHHERARAFQPGAEAAHAGGAHLSQPRLSAAARDGVGDGAVGGMGQRATLSGPGAARGGAGATSDAR